MLSSFAHSFTLVGDFIKITRNLVFNLSLYVIVRRGFPSVCWEDLIQDKRSIDSENVGTESNSSTFNQSNCVCFFFTKCFISSSIDWNSGESLADAKRLKAWTMAEKRRWTLERFTEKMVLWQRTYQLCQAFSFKRNQWNNWRKHVYQMSVVRLPLLLVYDLCFVFVFFNFRMWWNVFVFKSCSNVSSIFIQRPIVTKIGNGMDTYFFLSVKQVPAVKYDISGWHALYGFHQFFCGYCVDRP